MSCPVTVVPKVVVRGGCDIRKSILKDNRFSFPLGLSFACSGTAESLFPIGDLFVSLTTYSGRVISN